EQVPSARETGAVACRSSKFPMDHVTASVQTVAKEATLQGAMLTLMYQCPQLQMMSRYRCLFESSVSTSILSLSCSGELLWASLQ
ncbi:unnamed protein product, partial [Symbiodinium pilosum]